MSFNLLAVFQELVLPSVKAEQAEVTEGILKWDVFAFVSLDLGKC